MLRKVDALTILFIHAHFDGYALWSIVAFAQCVLNVVLVDVH